MKRRFSELDLERYRLGELPPQEAAELRRCLGEDEALAARLLELDRSSEAIRAQQLPARMAEGVRRRTEDRIRSGPRTVVLAALAAAALAVLAVMPRALGPAADDGIRVKGLEPALLLFRKTPAGSEALEDGARVRVGDVIRVGYRAAGRRYGAILSIDGRGAVTRHLPREGREAARLAAGDANLLDQAYELDDAPRWERFFLVTADEPFDVGPALQAAREAARSAAGSPPRDLRLAPTLRQHVFTLEKETGR